jgi:LPS sulfotransferase NodH
MPDDRSSLEYILSQEDGSRLIAWFATLGPDTLVLAPPFIRRIILAQAPTCAACWWSGLPDAAALPPDATNIVVVSEFADSEAQAEMMYKTADQTHVYGFYKHIIPAITADADPMSYNQRHHPEKRYALFCVPRSGSTYLCALLTNAGLGAPAEHLRVSADHAIGRAGLSFATWLEAIELYGNVDGIFGTKIIPHHVFPASGRNYQRLSAIVDEFAEKGYVLFFLRRKLVDCIVSSLIALAARRWHVFSEEARLRLADSVDLSAIDDALLQRQITHCVADLLILSAVLRRPDVVEFDYDALTARPATVVAQVRGALRLGPTAESGRALVPLPTSGVISAYAIIKKAICDRVARESEQLASITLRRMMTKTGLPLAGIERFIGVDPARMIAIFGALGELR